MNGNQIDNTLVNEVINSLPSQVQDFVKHHCAVTIVPRDFGGFTLSEDQHRQPYIIIYYESGKQGQNNKHLIAHEIAHAFLAHRCNQQQADLQQQDVAAEAQVMEWGLHTDQINS